MAPARGWQTHYDARALRTPLIAGLQPGGSAITRVENYPGFKTSSRTMARSRCAPAEHVGPRYRDTWSRRTVIGPSA